MVGCWFFVVMGIIALLLVRASKLTLYLLTSQGLILFGPHERAKTVAVVYPLDSE